MGCFRYIIEILCIMVMTIIIKQGNRGKIWHWTLAWPRTKTVGTNHGNKVTISWYQQVQTNRTIPNNNSNIINRDKEKWTCLSVATISGDRNVIKKESEKILNCQRFTLGIGCPRNVKKESDTSCNRDNWNHFQNI
jgi:hypothetical protein